MPVTLSMCASLARWRSSLATELRPVELAHFALDVPILPVHLQEALGQLDRLRLRLRLEDRVAADHFLRLRERPIDRGQLAAAQAHAYPFLGRPEVSSVRSRACTTRSAGGARDRCASAARRARRRRRAARGCW